VVRLWDAASGKEVGPLAGGNEGSNNTALAFSPDGRVLAAANADGVVRLWEPATRKLVGQLEGHHR
jgi:WD40 repeat protein